MGLWRRLCFQNRPVITQNWLIPCTIWLVSWSIGVWIWYQSGVTGMRMDWKIIFGMSSKLPSDEKFCIRIFISAYTYPGVRIVMLYPVFIYAVVIFNHCTTRFMLSCSCWLSNDACYIPWFYQLRVLLCKMLCQKWRNKTVKSIM